MAAVGKLFNICRVATTGGSGALTLGAAATGFLTFVTAGVPDATLITYGIEDGAAREVGRGTMSASGLTLTRTTVIASTNGGAAIAASSGAQVFGTAIAEDFALTTTPGTSGQVIIGQGATSTSTWNTMTGDVTTSAAAVMTLNAQYRFHQPLFIT